MAQTSARRRTRSGKPKLSTQPGNSFRQPRRLFVRRRFRGVPLEMLERSAVLVGLQREKPQVQPTLVCIRIRVGEVFERLLAPFSTPVDRCENGAVDPAFNVKRIEPQRVFGQSARLFKILPVDQLVAEPANGLDAVGMRLVVRHSLLQNWILLLFAGAAHRWSPAGGAAALLPRLLLLAQQQTQDDKKE